MSGIEVELTDKQLAESLRCCAEGKRAGCRECPMRPDPTSGTECFGAMLLKAAERIGALAEEIRMLRAATEEYAQELVQRMVTLAREGNTAGVRGLEKVSGDQVMELNAIQAKLAALGRKSVVHAQPVAGQGWQVDWITVEDREIWRKEAAQDAEV